MPSLTKNHITKLLRQNHNLSPEYSRTVLDAFLNAIMQSIDESGEITVKNFGKFERIKKTVDKPTYNFKSKTLEVRTIDVDKITFHPSRTLTLKVFN